MGDRKQPHWTSSFQSLPFVTPFPGMDKGTRKLDTDIISIQFALSCSFDSSTAPNKRLLIFPLWYSVCSEED